MAFEKLDATQLCSWAPPLPQRAFPVQAAGVTTEGASLGGTAVNGQRYGYFLLDTSQWTVQPGLTLTPLSVGERFQLCTASGNSFFEQPQEFAGGEAIPQATEVTASTVTVTVPDGNGNWIAVSWPSYQNFASFFVQVGGSAAGFYPNGLTAAQIDTAIGDNDGTVGSTVVVVNVPDGAGGWMAVSWPAYADFASFFTQVGGNAAGFYPNGLDATTILTAIAQNGGTVVPPGSFAGQVVNSAPDLFNVAGMFPAFYTVKDPSLCAVVSTRQAASNSWYVYYSPYNPSVVARPGPDGIVTVPELSSPRWLGQVGHVAGLSYSYAIPGGPDQLSCQLQVEPSYRTEALNPGRVITAHRGGSCIWEGTLTEPAPSPTGWALTANGCGTYGTNFGAWWELDFPASWSLDFPVSLAIARGLRWTNYGLGNPGSAYLGPVQNPGSLTITDFMNLLCTGGALSWQLVQPASASSFPPGPWVLSLFPLPTDATGNTVAQQVAASLTSGLYALSRWSRTDLASTLSRRPPDLYIVNVNPVGRTITADINTLILYYQVSPDTPATDTAPAIAATYSTAFADVPASVALHGRLEYYLDVSSSGPMTQPQAAQIAQNVLSKYVRANFSGSFSVQPGQLLNIGGHPVDLGCNWGGYIASVQAENFAAGGEVGFGPMTFQIGEYEFSDDTQTATVTPYQNARTDIASVIAQLYPGKFA
jgi:hypothetical protein